MVYFCLGVFSLFQSPFYIKYLLSIFHAFAVLTPSRNHRRLPISTRTGIRARSMTYHTDKETISPIANTRISPSLTAKIQFNFEQLSSIPRLNPYINEQPGILFIHPSHRTYSTWPPIKTKLKYTLIGFQTYHDYTLPIRTPSLIFITFQCSIKINQFQFWSFFGKIPRL